MIGKKFDTENTRTVFPVLWNRLSNYLLLKCKSNYLFSLANTDCLRFVLVLKLQEKQISEQV